MGPAIQTVLFVTRHAMECMTSLAHSCGWCCLPRSARPHD